jgi:peptide/nickel transport system permease protein
MAERDVRRVLVGGALVVAGGALLVGATAVLTSSSATVRWPIAIAGLYVLWRGLDAACKAAFDPGFQTGFWLAVTWLVVIVALAALAGVLPLQGPRALPLHAKGFIRPSLFSAHPLGTDEFGRDELARLIYGARPSLIIGVCAATTGMVVGTVLGILAGYYRGKVEALIDLMTDVALSYPPLVLLLAMVAFLRPSLPTIVLALSILTIPSLTRLSKSSTLSYARREFVLAARTIGASNRRVMFRELLPSVALPVMSLAFVLVAALILAEASLSFLGLGIKPPNPSWGNMIAAQQATFVKNPHTILVPGLGLLLTVLSLNRVGDRIGGRSVRQRALRDVTEFV